MKRKVTQRFILLLCWTIRIVPIRFLSHRDEKCELVIVIGKSTRSTRATLKMQYDCNKYFMVTSTCNRSLCKRRWRRPRRRAESWEKTRTNELYGFFIVTHTHTHSHSCPLSRGVILYIHIVYPNNHFHSASIGLINSEKKIYSNKLQSNYIVLVILHDDNAKRAGK